MQQLLFNVITIGYGTRASVVRRELGLSHFLQAVSVNNVKLMERLFRRLPTRVNSSYLGSEIRKNTYHIQQTRRIATVAKTLTEIVTTVPKSNFVTNCNLCYSFFRFVSIKRILTSTAASYMIRFRNINIDLALKVCQRFKAYSVRIFSDHNINFIFEVCNTLWALI